MERGITLIELLLVISIIAVIGLVTTPFLSRFVLQTNFDTTVETLVSSLRKAQGYAMDGKNSVVWGVCKSENKIRLYAGSCVTPTTSENYSIPGSVTVDNLNATAFNLRGEPSGALSILVRTGLESAIIEVNTAGGITVN